MASLSSCAIKTTAHALTGPVGRWRQTERKKMDSREGRDSRAVVDDESLAGNVTEWEWVSSDREGLSALILGERGVNRDQTVATVRPSPVQQATPSTLLRSGHPRRHCEDAVVFAETMNVHTPYHTLASGTRVTGVGSIDRAQRKSPLSNHSNEEAHP